MLGGRYYLANHLRASQSARQKHYSLVWYIQIIIITIIIILIVIIIIIGWIHKHNFEQYQSSFIHSYPQFKYMSNSCIIVVYLHIYGHVIDSHNDLLPVGLRAQLVSTAPVSQRSGFVSVSLESLCFPWLRLGTSQDSREKETNGFPRDHKLSVY